MGHGAVLGREGLLAQAREQLVAGSVVLYGAAGIGKSTMLNAVASAVPAETVVLRSAPGPGERGIPFLAMADLLETITPQWWELVPAPQRSALQCAIRQRPAAGEPDLLAVRLAMLSLVRAIGASAPVLIVLDDLQWVDPASAELLAFVARRTAADPALRVLASERIEPPHELTIPALCPEPVAALAVPALDRDATVELARRHGCATDTARIHELTGGNPLFVIEISRAIANRDSQPPGDRLPVPERLRGLLRERLNALSEQARATLLRAAATARPSAALLLHSGRLTAEPDLAEAVAAGIVRIAGDGTVQFTHPLLRATLYEDADLPQRQAVHAELAVAAADPVEQARHLANAAPGLDERLAGLLQRAAGSARQRGAPGVAAELGLLAADRTPLRRRIAATNRRLRAAADALAAGQHELARRLASTVLDTAKTTRRQRVESCLVLVDAARHTLATTEPVFRRALSEAGGVPALEAPVRFRHAVHAAIAGDFGTAARGLGRAAELASAGRDRTTEVMALCSLALCQVVLGDETATSTLARAMAVRPTPERVPVHGGPGWVLARFELFADRLDTADAELSALLDQAEQRGELGDAIAMTWSAVEIMVARGRCGPAMAKAADCLRLAESAGADLGPARYAAALAEAVGGNPRTATELAKSGAQKAADDGDRAFVLRNLHAHGLALLAMGEPVDAVGPLSRAALIERELGVADPAVFWLRADLAEALVAAGRLTEAGELIETARIQAKTLGRRGVLAAVDRADAMLRLALRDTDDALRLLRAATETQCALGQPVQYGRSLIWLGIAERRRRHRGAARDALTRAHRVFTETGALPWAERAQTVLGAEPDPEPGAAAGPALTGLELRIARLITGGATNREAAARLNVSVKTVEGALTRIYRKVSVRSRTELSARLTSLETDQPHRTP